MKLRYSLFTRRRFLNSLFGGWLSLFAATAAAPLLRFLFPPQREPEEIRLPFSSFRDMPQNSTEMFAWGAKPGLLKKSDNGSLTAFVAVCTHLDCNVTYLPEKKKFYCACHEGWYDENGDNIGGPPPNPLRRLVISVEGEELIIRRQGNNE